MAIFSTTLIVAVARRRVVVQDTARRFTHTFFEFHSRGEWIECGVAISVGGSPPSCGPPGLGARDRGAECGCVCVTPVLSAVKIPGSGPKVRRKSPFVTFMSHLFTQRATLLSPHDMSFLLITGGAAPARLDQARAQNGGTRHGRTLRPRPWDPLMAPKWCACPSEVTWGWGLARCALS